LFGQRSISVKIWDRLSSKDQNNLLNRICYLKGQILTDRLFEPVIKTSIFVNQETPHLSMSPFTPLETMPLSVSSRNDWNF
jgi:hypothetical protein